MQTTIDEREKALCAEFDLLSQNTNTISYPGYLFSNEKKFYKKLGDLKEFSFTDNDVSIKLKVLPGKRLLIKKSKKGYLDTFEFVHWNHRSQWLAKKRKYFEKNLRKLQESLSALSELERTLEA